jgi:hypothetical protein
MSTSFAFLYVVYIRFHFWDQGMIPTISLRLGGMLRLRMIFATLAADLDGFAEG